VKLSQIAVDVQAEDEGEWRDHPYFEGVKVLVRSQECDAYQRAQRELLNGRQLRRTKLGDATQDGKEITRRLMPVLIRGWRGIDEAEYSEETAKSWVEDDVLWKKSRLFWDGIVELAQDVGEDEAEAHEEALGN